MVQSLLDDYAACGIRVQFQDLTTELGLPVYQCFVTGRDGRVARATGANLCGARAALLRLLKRRGRTQHRKQNPRFPLLQDWPDCPFVC